MARSDEVTKAFDRLRQLARDPVAAPYLVGYLLQFLDERNYPTLVEAALVYRERFGAAGNDRIEALVPPLSFDQDWRSGVLEGGNQRLGELLRERFK